MSRFFKFIFFKLVIAALLIDIIILVKIVIKAQFCYTNTVCLAKLRDIIVFVKLEKVPFRKHPFSVSIMPKQKLPVVLGVPLLPNIITSSLMFILTKIDVITNYKMNVF